MNTRASVLAVKEMPLVIACNAWSEDTMGGAYRIASDFAVFCAARGRQVHYVCSHPEGTGQRPDWDKGVNVWRYRQPFKSGQGKRLGNFYGHQRGAAAVLGRIRSSLKNVSGFVLNGHTALQYYAMLGQSSGSRKVMSVHSPLVDEYLAEKTPAASGWKKSLAVAALSYVERVACQKSDQVQCFSGFTLSLLERRYGRSFRDKASVCPGYVDFERYRLAATSRAEARKRISRVPWGGEDVHFFSLRRHVQRMGLEKLIEACAWLRDRSVAGGHKPAFRLVLGGDGPLRPQLERQSFELGLKDFVFFAGALTEKELPLYYRAADCFVLPSVELECFGLVILESFAAGTPVLATPVGAIPEVLGPLAGRSLAPGTDAPSLGTAMFKFIQKKALPPDEGELVRYAKNFDKDLILARLESLVMGQDHE